MPRKQELDLPVRVSPLGPFQFPYQQQKTHIWHDGRFGENGGRNGKYEREGRKAEAGDEDLLIMKTRLQRRQGYRGLTYHVNKWKCSWGKKRGGLFPLRTDFISSYSPPYPSRHVSSELTAFSQTAPSLREKRASRAWNEITEVKEENGGLMEGRGGNYLGQGWWYG